jgi:hypothetical protein
MTYNRFKKNVFGALLNGNAKVHGFLSPSLLLAIKKAL